MVLVSKTSAVCPPTVAAWKSLSPLGAPTCTRPSPLAGPPSTAVADVALSVVTVMPRSRALADRLAAGRRAPDRTRLCQKFRSSAAKEAWGVLR